MDCLAHVAVILRAIIACHQNVRTDRQTDKDVNEKINKELVEPTAAGDWLPAKRPTTITSAALKEAGSTPESISGMEYVSTFPRIGPLHISIS